MDPPFDAFVKDGGGVLGVSKGTGLDEPLQGGLEVEAPGVGVPERSEERSVGTA
jgi:hypothetical protein